MAIDLPITGRGLALLVGLVLLTIVVIYASSMLTVLFGAVAIALVIYGVYLTGWKVDDWLKNGR